MSTMSTMSTRTIEPLIPNSIAEACLNPNPVVTVDVLDFPRCLSVEFCHAGEGDTVVPGVPRHACRTRIPSRDGIQHTQETSLLPDGERRREEQQRPVQPRPEA